MDPEKQLARALRKSVLKGSFDNGWKYHCPHCKKERRVFGPPNLTRKHYAQMAVTTLFLTVVAWPVFDIKGVTLFFPIWAAFEMIYRVRFRASLVCEYCGFDPTLYMVDVSAARVEIENHWRKRFEDLGIPYPDKTNQTIDIPGPKTLSAKDVSQQSNTPGQARTES